ncbi:MAG: response regulator [Gammaproteobacteria bacterium]|nr:response regulator [Gammaproteobacteria bacterium]
MDDSDHNSSAEAGVKVLYIEDNSANIKLMQDIFSEFLPYDFISAMNAKEGIALAKEQQPGLILMDINMEGMDGLEAFELIKHDANLATIPVFAISGDAMPEQIEKALALGFSDYISKPFNILNLIETINQCLNK